jgi:PKD repeat protein
MRRSGLIAAGITTFALAVLPASASAVTFCVEDAACSGTPHSTIKQALNAAAANGSGLDRIQVGAGTFSESDLADTSVNPVTIVGAGQGRTIVTRTPVNGQRVLRLGHFNSRVSDLTLTLPDGSNMTGLELGNGSTAERIFVTADAGRTNSAGVAIDGGVLSQSLVSLPNVPAAMNDGVRMDGFGLLESSRVSATVGLDIAGNGDLVRGNRIQGRTGITMNGQATDSAADVINTQVSVLPGGGDATGIKLHHLGDGKVTLRARHVTVNGLGAGADVGVGVQSPASIQGPEATIELTDSLVRGFVTDLRAQGGPAGKGNIIVSTSAFDFDRVVVTNSPSLTSIGPIPGSNVNLNGVDPRVNNVLGDFRPAFNSVLVDRGVPGGLLAGEPTVDLFGSPRLVDGNGDGTARRDIGAFEYQRSAPIISAASATPTTAVTGEAIAFTATATDADFGETPALTWTFDDGGSASGDSVQHAWATPGAHTATVTATDPAGASSSATVAVTINAAPATPGQPGVIDGSVALSIGRAALKLTRKGVAAVRVTCPAAEASGPCTGTLTLTTDKKVRRSRRAKAKKEKLGSKRFSIPAGRTVKVNVKLSRANLRLVKRLKRVRVRGAATVADKAGNRGKAAARFQLRAP